MKNLAKPLAYGIAGTALVVGSFVTYSAITGAKMNELAVVGGAFPEDVTAETEVAQNGQAKSDVDAEIASDSRSPRQVYENAATPLGAFALQDPFSAEELRALERQLQIKIEAVGRKARELDDREAQLDADQRHLDDLYSQIVKLQTSILEQEDDNNAQGDELERGRRVLEEREQASYAKVAFLFVDTKPAVAANMLTKNYGPEEAAMILANLEDDRVREILGQIQTDLPNEAQQYLRAYQDLPAAKKK